MNHCEMLKNWLESYPDWQMTVAVNFTGNRPGCAGLFPKTSKILWNKEDVAGNGSVHLQDTYSLFPVFIRKENGRREAGIVEAFMKWAHTQSLMGKLPGLGDAQVSLRAEGGQLRDTPQPGIARYELTLIAEYTNYYEVI